ncbi:hypothetical protein T4D_6485 [Trichinella pseudospiralis]|uniref:Uncharacterized protein n=1 Tax=Trichinella pseudospiralis TaxID=6337 RepID=A0A0V1FAC6_TRIPS|nr:hypothetical protein T4D_6485 [Trichinella pseudospiralis]
MYWVAQKTEPLSILFSNQYMECFRSGYQQHGPNGQSCRGIAHSTIGCRHPSVWKFTDVLKKEHELNIVKIEQLVTEVYLRLKGRNITSLVYNYLRWQSIVGDVIYCFLVQKLPWRFNVTPCTRSRITQSCIRDITRLYIRMAHIEAV